MSSAISTELLPLGILGGTFDPVHCAHLRLALEARELLGLERVRLIPVGSPPHRDRPASDAVHRLAMVNCAVAGLEGFEVDAGEVYDAAPSYTVHTLLRLRAELGAERPLVLLMGADAFLGLESWHRWQELFGLAHIGVATRPGFELGGSGLSEILADELVRRACTDAAALRTAPAGLVMPFPITPLTISATAIRAAFQHGRSARFLLPESVLDYIEQHNLYRN